MGLQRLCFWNRLIWQYVCMFLWMNEPRLVSSLKVESVNPYLWKVFKLYLFLWQQIVINKSIRIENGWFLCRAWRRSWKRKTWLSACWEQLCIRFRRSLTFWLDVHYFNHIIIALCWRKKQKPMHICLSNCNWTYL